MENGKEYIEIDNNRYYYAKSISDAGAYVRVQILEHKDCIKVACAAPARKSGEVLWEDIETSIYSEKDADYIELLLMGLEVEVSDTEDGMFFYECSPCYYMTAKQEKQLEDKISGLSLAGKNQYETARNIYRYICRNVSYDWDYDTASFSAYGALIRKKAVCQGFSMLYYLIGKRAGLDVAIVCGTGNDDGGWVDHAWNVVKLGGKYYYLDSTWDSKEDRYSYFLKGSKSFLKEHKVDSHNKYNVSTSDYTLPMADRHTYDSSYTPLVSKVKLYGTGISHKLAAGKKIQFKASVTPSYAANKNLTWSSSNKKVATVSQSGKVSIKKKTGGKTVKITAMAKDGSGKKAVWKIRVMKGAVKKISIKGKNTVKAGKTLRLTAKVTAAKGANKQVEWISGNKKYAKVTSAGKVQALKAGKGKKVKITAIATDGSKIKASIVIKIK